MVFLQSQATVAFVGNMRQVTMECSYPYVTACTPSATRLGTGTRFPSSVYWCETLWVRQKERQHQTIERLRWVTYMMWVQWCACARKFSHWMLCSREVNFLAVLPAVMCCVKWWKEKNLCSSVAHVRGLETRIRAALWCRHPFLHCCMQTYESRCEWEPTLRKCVRDLATRKTG